MYLFGGVINPTSVGMPQCSSSLPTQIGLTSNSASKISRISGWLGIVRNCHFQFYILENNDIFKAESPMSNIKRGALEQWPEW